VALGRPTILQIIPNLDAGGAELAVVEIADAVVRAGGRALVLTQGGRLTRAVEAAGGRVIAFPAASKNPVRMWTNAQRMARIIEAEHVDLAHARSRAPAWSTLFAARRTGAAFVTTYHGAYGERNAVKRAYNSIMARSDVVIANSNFTARLIAARHGTPPERIAVIHRGVDALRFDPARIASERLLKLRAAWRIGDAPRIVLQAARLASWKGQAVLIDAFAQLPADLAAGAVLVLAGDPQGRESYRRALLELSARRGIGERVRLVGHVEDMAAAFCAAHVSVVASTAPEAFGRVAIEAGAMGCPVIATDLGAPPETLQTEPAVPLSVITGWLVPPGDAHALTRRLAEALALSGPERARLGERARRHVLTNFTVEAMQSATLRVYDRLLGSDLEQRFAKAGTRRNAATNLGEES
jgi:glycosyltransferase involved in cell wall biosynthesis